MNTNNPYNLLNTSVFDAMQKISKQLNDSALVAATKEIHPQIQSTLYYQ